MIQVSVETLHDINGRDFCSDIPPLLVLGGCLWLHCYLCAAMATQLGANEALASVQCLKYDCNLPNDSKTIIFVT